MYFNIIISIVIMVVMEILIVIRIVIFVINGVFGFCVDLNIFGEYNRLKKKCYCL